LHMKDLLEKLVDELIRILGKHSIISKEAILSK